MRDTAESQVTVTVPLYMSYVYVTAPRGWGAVDHRTTMQVNFRYENVLWKSGESNYCYLQKITRFVEKC